MRTFSVLFLTLMAVFPGLAFAQDVIVEDAYARSGQKSGAAFFVVTNTTDAPVTLIGAASDVAAKVELHTHLEDDNGVMRMRPIEGGITIGAGQSHALTRGGDHVMFMGVAQPFSDGEVVVLTLMFEDGATLEVEIPVDNRR